MLVLQPGCYQNMFITLLWATEAPKIAPFYDDRGIRISESGLMALGIHKSFLLFKNPLIIVLSTYSATPSTHTTYLSVSRSAPRVEVWSEGSH